MLTLVWAVLCLIGFAFFAIAATRENALILGWISTLIFFFLMLGAFGMEEPFCSYDAAAWACTTNTKVDENLGYFMFGLAFLTLAINVLWSLGWGVKYASGRDADLRNTITR